MLAALVFCTQEKATMTFSLVARCAESGMFGIVISSSSPAVAARCSHARAGIGAVTSQNITDPSLGTRALDLMALGASANEAVDILRRTGRYMAYRQVLAVDTEGRTAIHSGAEALGVWAQAEAADVAGGGNLLADPGVPQAMVDDFCASRGHLGDRLISALQAGLSAGGEAGPVHSAGMLLVDKVAWPVADLRCDWTDACPVQVVAQAWQVYQPQLDAYLQRAADPRQAPAYGVAGERQAAGAELPG
jgi:uncharacterized Ntn-hydrolase superfamily protein